MDQHLLFCRQRVVLAVVVVSLQDEERNLARHLAVVVRGRTALIGCRTSPAGDVRLGRHNSVGIAAVHRERVVGLAGCARACLAGVVVAMVVVVVVVVVVVTWE